MTIFANLFANGSQTRSRVGSSLRTARRSGVLSLLAVAGAICLFAASPAWAAGNVDDDAGDTAAAAANTRAVRLSNAEGSVRVTQDGQIIADPATANLPLFAGSQVTTGGDGQAEIQLEDGSVVRLSPNSALTFAAMDQQGTATHTDVVLNGGLAYFELQPSTAEHSLRVSYGTASFSASSFSVVRIAMDTPPGELAVFSGNLHLERGNALQLDVHAGESLSLDTSDLTHYNLSESIEPNSWDSWNSDRDQALNAESAQKTAASGAYVNSQAVGMGDLDANGSWYNVPGQGYIWSPYDAQYQGAAWDPYGFGQWVYYPRYGYVWVSGYGWGYAPYQCGLWNFYDSIGWGWAPGGGCNPWWGGGGWGYVIGNPPRGYRPPHRPIPGPIHPHPIGRPLQPASIIPVDRRHDGGVLTARNSHPAEPVVIGGHAVEPLRPVAPRPVYDRPGGTLGNHPSSGYLGTGNSGAQPVYSGLQGHPMPPSGGGQPVYHPQPAPAPSHPTYSGGGGGGGGHPSGGGGGGGASMGGGGHMGGGGGGGVHK